MSRTAILSAAALMLAACATTPESETTAARAEPLGTQACFYQRNVTGFRYLDRSNLIVYAPGRSNAYRVTISPPSFELRSADAIAFASRGGRICGYAGESLLIDRGTDRRYAVIDVRQIDAAALDALLGPDEEKLSPEPAEGAEIEREVEPEAGATEPQDE